MAKYIRNTRPQIYPIAQLLSTLLLLQPAAAIGDATRLDPQAPLHRQILQLERERMDAYRHQDVDYLAEHFAEEYLHTNLNGGTTTKAQELAFYATADFSLEAGEIGRFTMHRYGDVVVATGRVSWTGARYKGVDLSGDYSVTRVYVQHDGRWLLATSHASKVGGPSPARP